VVHRQGLSVPQDFSIVGFDDIELSDIVYPPLTTLRLCRRELAQMFYKALKSAEADPNEMGKQYTVDTALVVRSSTGPAKKV
jgi:LacI family transcriptional regulator